ncbi:MAG: hypothetical protein ABR589_13200, partial [Chthoniobacterales bacterium]
MRKLFLALLVLQSASIFSAGKLPPLTVKDVSLMLRSGYSVPAVEREVAVRHFTDSVDATAEKALLGAGATPAFVAALKSGAYAIPAEELAAVQEELAAKASRQAAQAEESRNMNTLYQSQLARERAAAAVRPGPASNA